jgi:hypothetical protein
MTVGGWCLMIGSIGFVLALNLFCFARVLLAPVTKGHIQAPLEIDTKERE